MLVSARVCFVTCHDAGGGTWSMSISTIGADEMMLTREKLFEFFRETWVD